jgi:hypothetical protein
MSSIDRGEWTGPDAQAHPNDKPRLQVASRRYMQPAATYYFGPRVITTVFSCCF